MEELYRYLLVRPAEAVDLEASVDVVNLSQEDNFQSSLRNTASQAERDKIAKTFIGSDAFIIGQAQIAHGAALAKVADQYRATPISKLLDTDEVLSTVIAILVPSVRNGGPAGSTREARQAWLQSLTEAAPWIEAEARLRNSIIAIRETTLHSRSMAPLADLLRAMQLVSILAVTTEPTVRPGAIVKATFYLPDAREREAPHEPSEDDLVERRPDRSALQQEFMRVSKAIDELMHAPLTQMEVEETEERSESGAADGQSPEREVSIRVVQRVKLGNAFDRLSSETKTVLADLQLDPQEETLPALVDVLRSHQRKSAVELYDGPGVIIDGTSLPVQSARALGQLGVSPLPALPVVPTTSGHVAPVGVGDLLIVKQHLKRYEGGDLAHVENILQGESKEREHRRRRLSETVFASETETEVSDERETQTTSRFEMRLEVQKQMQEELGVEAGLKVSASYGPTVAVEANTQFAYKNAKSESHSRATALSKELVDRAATSYRERLREQITRRLVEEVEELNRHALDATGADQHIVGMYQWLNKIYEAQVYNYGLRTMYEFMVPEPAAYYIWSLGQRAEATEGLSVPPPFAVGKFGFHSPLAPRDINEGNYDKLVARYEAAEVGSPPEPFITRAVEKSGGPNPDGLFVDFEEVAIPDGYEYLSHEHDREFSGLPQKPLVIMVGDEYKRPGEVPVLFYGVYMKGYTAFVQVLCRRTDAALEAWRNKVWDALHQGHLQQVAAYEEKLAALMAQAGVQIQGRNPYFNRRIEQTELKKSCIALLTGTYPDWVKSIDETKVGPVQKATNSKLQGAYIRFIEQAFEWENMTYVFYPYFWARASHWQSLLAVEDVDPSFQEFLTSGFARVVVPVRRGFEPAAEHFRQTGQVWSGGELPVITDPDYLPIWEEIKERLDAPGEETPVDEPWEVLVPTQLVKLRQVATLPKWEKQQDGTWQEV